MKSLIAIAIVGVACLAMPKTSEGTIISEYSVLSHTTAVVDTSDIQSVTNDSANGQLMGDQPVSDEVACRRPLRRLFRALRRGARALVLRSC